MYYLISVRNIQAELFCYYNFSTMINKKRF